jgi:hypothetical protein
MEGDICEMRRLESFSLFFKYEGFGMKGQEANCE